jgi:hypothetical protein
MGANFLTGRRLFYLFITVGFLAIASFFLFRLFVQRPLITIPKEFNVSAYRLLPVTDKCYQVKYDFESESGPNIKSLKRDGQDEPTWVFVFTDSLEYGPTFSSKIKSICETAIFGKLVFTCDVFASRRDLPVPVVVSVEFEGKSLFWKSVNMPIVESKWKNVSMEFLLPADSLDPEAELKVYIWNNSKHAFMIDNMHVDFISGGGEIQAYGFYPERHVSLDFDTPNEQDISNVHTNGPSRSGKGSCKLGFFNPFSPVITRRVGAVADGPMKDVTVRAEVFPAFDNPILNFAVSLSDSSGQEYFFKARSDSRKYEGGRWTPMKANMDLPTERIKPNDVISIYVWNKGFQNVYIDDFEVQFAESNKRVGQKPVIDMYAYGDRGYDFKTNVPPFRKITLEAFQIQGVLSVSDSIGHDFQVKPLNTFDKILAGKFGAAGSNQSQLAVLRNQNLFFFGLCNGESDWSQLARFSISKIHGLDMMNSTWIAQDMNGDDYDELIVYKKGNDYLHVLSPDRSIPMATCNFSISGSVTATKLSLDASASGSVYDLIACNDFLGTKDPEILLADMMNGKFLLSDAKGGLISKGENDCFKSANPSEFIADPVQLYSANDKKQLAIRPNESSGFSYFELNDKGPNWVEQKVPGSDLLPFLGCDEIMSGSNQRSPSILFHRTVPKFGLFAVSCDPLSGFAIQNEFDFSGYIGQKNPKYYEKRILFSGDFTGRGNNELLIISSNCGDAKFTGFDCSNPDWSAPFPPTCFIFKLD